MSADDKADAAWDDYVSQQQQEKIEELERQLNEANQRIKRLERAGDRMADLLEDEILMKLTVLWRKAKEAKP
jgi:predicted RNase H-like nuclease (RuvC/YqgF family)